MIFYRHHITFLFCLLFACTSVSQINDSLPGVRVISRVQKDQILLRWAVDNASVWKKTNDSGFILEKFLFSIEGNRLPQPQKIWEKAIKADPLESWQEMATTNDFAAVIAQALYGESFMVEGSQGELADIVNLVEENEQRFSMSLLAADMNFEAAIKAGWGYIDTDVKINERYAYRIKAAASQDDSPINASTVLAGLVNYEVLPAPIDLQGIYGDKNVILTWEYELFKSIYTSYNLERSEDGKVFKPISKEPLVNLNDKPNAPAKRMYYIDSLAQNNKIYYYRVNGVSPFSEKGAYSDVISGQGQPSLLVTPRINNFRFNENDPNEVTIYWEFPTEAEQTITHFELNQSEQDSGPYKVVVDDIAISKREVDYSNLNPSNYFKITAVGKVPNQQKTSYGTLIQPEDTSPPEIPVELIGSIDTLGIVNVSWKMNAEKDLLGYRVFRAFREQEEPSQLTISPIAINTFIDTVEVKNLNSKVYYQIVAVDKRFNNSEKSKALVLEKPDVIPPTAPVFKDYGIKDGQIMIRWIPSSRTGVSHILSRKNKTMNGAWKEVFKVTDTLSTYIDKEVDNNNSYIYSIKAVSQSGLQSLPSTPLTIDVLDLRIPELIKSFSFTVDRENNYIELFWRANDKSIAEYTIYKQVNEEALSTWRIVPSTIKRLIDQDINPNQVYTYHLRPTLVDGTYGKVETLEIKY